VEDFVGIGSILLLQARENLDRHATAAYPLARWNLGKSCSKVYDNDDVHSHVLFTLC